MPAWQSPRPRHQAPYFSPPPIQHDSKTLSNSISGPRLTLKPQRRFHSTRLPAESVLSPAPAPVLESAKLRTPRRRICGCLLVAQVLLSLTILVLAVLFAYCIALPHSQAGFVRPADIDSADPAMVAPTTTTTATLLSTKQTGTSASYTLRRHRDVHLKGIAPEDSNLAPDDGGPENDMDLSSDSPMTSPTVVLTLYSATLPLATMISASIALLITLRRPQKLSVTATHHQTYESPSLLRSDIARRQMTLCVLLACSSLLWLGWIINNSFWTFCELSVSSQSSSAAAATPGIISMDRRRAICPASVIDHHMRGVSGVSISKVVLAWLLVVVQGAYLAALVLMVRRSRV